MFASSSSGTNSSKMTIATSSASTSASTIQKAKNKRTVLPKASLIQLYLNNSQETNTTSTINMIHKASNYNHHRTQLLPKFNQQDIIDKLKDVTTTIQPVRKIVKEVLCNTNNNTSSRRSLSVSSSAKSNLIDLDGLGSSGEEKSKRAVNSNAFSNSAANDDNYSSRESLIRHLTREFLLDCKQRLDLESFKKCLVILADANKSSALQLNMVNIFVLFKN